MARGVGWLYLTTLIVTLLLAPLAVHAAPPFTTTVEQAGSLTVQYPKVVYYTVGKPFDLHFHVFNDSGYPMTNSTVNCSLHLYNGSNNEHTLKIAKMDFDGNEWEAEGLVYNDTITLAYIAYCVQTSTSKGGFSSGEIRVTKTGYDDQNTDLSIFSVIALIPFLLSGLFFAAAYYFRNEEDHKTYALGMYLFSLMFLLAGFGYSIYLTSFYYYNPELADFTATFLYGFGVILFVIFAYWCLYWIRRAMDYAHRKRNGEE